MATSFQYPIPTSSETFDPMVDAAANRGLQVEIEARHIRTQLHELHCTAVDLATSAEMSYCCVVEAFCEEFCVDLLDVSVPRSIVMGGSVGIKEVLALK
jgi:hypothetical protein